MKFLSNARTRWFLLAGLWAALIVLGIGGFREQAQANGTDDSFLQMLYLTLQLATLQFDGSDENLNWRLQIARFVAPIMAAGTVLQAASVVFVDQFRRFRLRFARDHTVICGLGDVGTRLAVAHAARGDTVVAIEPDASVTGVASAKDADITVLIGDAADPALLRVARIDRAAVAVAVCGDDATNVRIALTAADLVKARPGKALRCAVHLDDADLTNLLRAADLDSRSSVRMTFFNTHERVARALLSEHPAFETGDSRSHPVVFGLGQLGRSLVVALAQQWAQHDPEHPLGISLVDPNASGRWEALRLQHPALDAACRPTLIDLDLEAPTSANVEALTTLFSTDDATTKPTWIAIVMADESLTLSTAFFIQQSLDVRDIPLIVRTRTDVGLGALLIPGTGRSDIGATPTLRAFPFLDRTCTTTSVEGGVREQLAEAVHDDYLGQNRNNLAVDPALVRPWDLLDDDQRDLSRRRVDGIIDDLAAIGCELIPLRRWGVPVTELSSSEMEQLAAREHKRWYDDRVADGWTYGPTRDNAAKKNPLLVAWDQLPNEAVDTNVKSVGQLTTMLARAGFEPIRRQPG